MSAFLPHVPSAFDSVLADMVAQLDPSHPSFRNKTERLEVEESREAMERNFRAFVPAAWRQIDPAPFVPTWHVDAVADHLQAVTTGSIHRLIINQPPGTAKTLVASVLFPAYEWGPANLPQLRYAVTSYGINPSLRAAEKSRALMRSDWYRARWGNRFGFVPDVDAKSYFQNTHGGYRHSSGLGGDLTGTRANRLVIDDPSKRTDGLNPRALDRVVEYYGTTLSKVLVSDESAIICIMQRLSERDLVGHFLERLEEDGWVVLRLPRFYEPSNRCVTFVNGDVFFEDPRTTEGEALTPELPAFRSRASVDADRVAYGEWVFSAQEQQRPVPLVGGIIQLAWIQRWHERGTCGQGVCPKCYPDVFEELIESWDCTFKKTATGSWVVGQVWGRRHANAYLLDQVRGRWDLPETMKQLVDLSNRWPGAALKLIEDKANGPAVMQMLGNVVPGLVPVQANDSKIARAATIAPFFESGNVYVPEENANRPWVANYVVELTTFPKSAQGDDQMDVTSQALWRILGDRVTNHSGGFAKLNREALAAGRKPSRFFDTNPTGSGIGVTFDVASILRQFGR